MLSRRLYARQTGVASFSRHAIRRSLATSRPLQAPKPSPALGDILPDAGPAFDTKQREFRERLAAEAEARKRRELEESRLSATARENASSDSSSSSSGIIGSLTSKFADEARTRDEAGKKKGPLSSLIYGTAEGRELDKDIERSFSQVLARGKYVHSIVFHEVKPDKVNEYTELVGDWYPRMASMPENKVNLVGSWRTEVGDCDTFGACSH